MVSFNIEGADMQFLKVTFASGEKIYADSGHLISKDKNEGFNTISQGGFLSGLKRAITGSTFFVSELTGPGEVVLAGFFPGKIFPLELNGTSSLLAESHSFLAMESSVKYDFQMAKLGAGILAGEGLFSQNFQDMVRSFSMLTEGSLLKILSQAKGYRLKQDTCLHLMET
jgi:Uncharacterized conserved protein